MVQRYRVQLALLLALAASTPRAEASGREIRPIAWEGLSVVIGQTVRIVLPDGTRIDAKAKAVQDDALAVEIAKTSNQAAYPKGPFLVPRATLKAIDVGRPTKRWRAVGLSVGGGIGAFLGVLAIDLSESGFHTRHPVEGALIAGAIAVPVGGYLLGRAADRRTVTYVIKP